MNREQWTRPARMLTQVARFLPAYAGTSRFLPGIHGKAVKVAKNANF